MSLEEVNALEEQWRNERQENPVGVPRIMEPELDSLVTDRRVRFNHVLAMVQPYFNHLLTILGAYFYLARMILT